MPSAAHRLIADHIRQHGPITFAQFMELALYHPDLGYYASAAQRSGREGDFYTSVDVGPVFGWLLAEAFAQMLEALETEAPTKHSLDLIEAGAGSGRLSRDVMDGLQHAAPVFYDRVSLHLVERSAAARARQVEVLGAHATRLASSLPGLEPRPTTQHEEPCGSNPAGALAAPGWRGVLFANELLDAMPTHVVVGTASGVREIYIGLDARGNLVEREGPPSTPALPAYLERVGAQLEPGWRGEANLAAVEWLRAAASALDRGFIVLIDYGHEASTLYSASHGAGTLATFTSHVVEVHEAGRPQPWLRAPGESDITSHVDFTSMRRTAEEEGLEVLCLVDQAQFLTLLGRVERHLGRSTGSDRGSIAARLAIKTLLVPGGIGSTHRVMLLSKRLEPARFQPVLPTRGPSGLNRKLA